ncbi:hypothetical protein [Thalassotalea aquiviva]|uniref:hypothetical protein n=1 Tax=Thalassotalea aquiviva TaxID=3242415 RepID=UPI00352A3228
MNNLTTHDASVSGEFVTLNNDRFYAIKNVHKMAPFFISVVSNSDHWLFISSNGGLTAGRVSPETALFPYQTVDQIQDSALNTGSKTIVKVRSGEQDIYWEPFNTEHDDRFNIERNLYKNTLGNKLCFEERNLDLNLVFRYTWATSEEYGFVRDCELENIGDNQASVEFVDGLQNVLPAGTPRYTQANSANLVDAYKWTELEAESGLAFFTLFSGITDRAEPCESLRANTIFALGLDKPTTLLSSLQLENFKRGETLTTEAQKRGIRASYFVNTKVELAAGAKQTWQFVANIELSQVQSTELLVDLQDKTALAQKLADSVEHGSDDLARIMAATDGLQTTAEEEVSVHHYANVLFNAMRGGIFDDQYQILASDFSKTVKLFNTAVYERNQAFLESMPEKQSYNDLLDSVKEQNDLQLERLCCEYLPISFGRRHGDPSRPWNQFVIKLKDDEGNRLLTYQGNWRDIFQNWEAITFSYPSFIESVIAKFVNASTIDGYNPYRITKEGIDWEVEEPDDPWSYIGYWGDHQIIYLQKMLELSAKFHPAKLSEMFHKNIFSYANVPYRIKPLADIFENAKSTVMFDERLAEIIDQRVEKFGADGKMVLEADATVYQVNLLEKLAVALLSKLGNFVVGGGIWLNTQRPEWNDANNALVGQGLSMVTLCYLRRYVCFLQEQLANEQGDVELSAEVSEWLQSTLAGMIKMAQATSGSISDQLCFELTKELGQSACDYRQKVYQQEGFSAKVKMPMADFHALLENALTAIDYTIKVNKREDELYEAYNLMKLGDESLGVDTLYQMLEGQVAVLSSKALSTEETINVLENLFASDIYRQDQDSFILYPDRQLPSFLQKNQIAAEDISTNALLEQLLADGHVAIVSKDALGHYRFNSDFKNADCLKAQLAALPAKYDELKAANSAKTLALYEKVFNHNAFTGRSGGMFGFEGLGSIYWHMVSKLLLAVEENYEQALSEGNEENIKRLGQLYYRVRHGIGFNKTPEEYGAFPTDPYSHTPGHSGAQQPGMTGQVKEEVLTRFSELGIRVENGLVRFEPTLLRAQEFIESAASFKYLDLSDEWQTIQMPANALGFTWCQLPFVYQLTEAQPQLTIEYADGRRESFDTLSLSAEDSQHIFNRDGAIKCIEISLNAKDLFQG